MIDGECLLFVSPGVMPSRISSAVYWSRMPPERIEDPSIPSDATPEEEWQALRMGQGARRPRMVCVYRIQLPWHIC